MTNNVETANSRGEKIRGKTNKPCFQEIIPYGRRCKAQVQNLDDRNVRWGDWYLNELHLCDIDTCWNKARYTHVGLSMSEYTRNFYFGSKGPFIQGKVRRWFGSLKVQRLTRAYAFKHWCSKWLYREQRSKQDAYRQSPQLSQWYSASTAVVSSLQYRQKYSANLMPQFTQCWEESENYKEKIHYSIPKIYFNQDLYGHPSS